MARICQFNVEGRATRKLDQIKFGNENLCKRDSSFRGGGNRWAGEGSDFGARLHRALPIVNFAPSLTYCKPTGCHFVSHENVKRPYT